MKVKDVQVGEWLRVPRKPRQQWYVGQRNHLSKTPYLWVEVYGTDDDRGKWYDFDGPYGSQEEAKAEADKRNAEVPE